MIVIKKQKTTRKKLGSPPNTKREKTETWALLFLSFIVAFFTMTWYFPEALDKSNTIFTVVISAIAACFIGWPFEILLQAIRDANFAKWKSESDALNAERKSEKDAIEVERIKKRDTFETQVLADLEKAIFST